MRFVVDAQLPPALARWLSCQSYVGEHVVDIGLRDSDDSSIWNYALKYQAVIISKDEDFPTRALQSNKSPVIIWIRIGNCSNKALLAWFVPLFPQILTLIKQGDQIIELR